MLLLETQRCSIKNWWQESTQRGNIFQPVSPVGVGFPHNSRNWHIVLYCTCFFYCVVFSGLIPTPAYSSRQSKLLLMLPGSKWGPHFSPSETPVLCGQTRLALKKWGSAGLEIRRWQPRLQQPAGSGDSFGLKLALSELREAPGPAAVLCLNSALLSSNLPQLFAEECNSGWN